MLVTVGLLLLQVQMGTVVRPETVTVGQHFTATVRVRAASGASIIFPQSPDTAARVDTVTSPARRDVSGTGFIESTVTYTLAAWDTGMQRIALGDVTIGTGGAQRMASLRDMSVYVRSVLPLDTALRKPKPPRPEVVVTPFNWLPWAIAAGLLALLALLAWLWRWLRRRSSAPLTPLQWAERELERIDSLRLIEGGEPERHAIAVAGVLRGYLARAIAAANTSATTRELALGLMHEPMVQRDRVIMLLEEVDLVKFAAGRMSAERASAIGSEVRALITSTSTALAAEAARVAAAESQQAAA